jgi:L-alanine-DL-glutamate epimerase-like enolase superfamily enzyme
MDSRANSKERLVVQALKTRPLSVPLVEPFVIATGRVDATRSVEIEARVVFRGETAVGLGEAACLPPVTKEDQNDVLREVEGAAPLVIGQAIACAGLSASLAQAALGPVARAGVEAAILDAVARIAGLPVRAFVGGPVGAATTELETDVTVAIADPAHMAALASEWFARGFRALKVKVGKDVDADARALEAIGRAVPGARLRVDANAGYTAAEAISLARACDALGLTVECWEQPCAPEDLDGLAAVAAALTAPVVADESAKSLDDVRALIVGRCADAVNLKLVKCGGLLPALAMGRAARAGGLKLMVGGMVETRLGMTAAAHLACALGGADFVDLDTALLLADDPYLGGYVAAGPRYTMPDTPGLGVTRRAGAAPIAPRD